MLRFFRVLGGFPDRAGETTGRSFGTRGRKVRGNGLAQADSVMMGAVFGVAPRSRGRDSRAGRPRSPRVRRPGKGGT